MDTGVEIDYAAYVRARWDALVRSALLLGCSRVEAEDVVQTALLRCFTSWAKVQASDVPDAYVYRTLVNCLAKSRRRRWWQETPMSPLPDGQVDDLAESAASRATVLAALDTLTEQQRAVVVLRYYADLSERQVAEALGIPAGTVKSRLSRGLDRLGRELSDHGVDARQDEEKTC
jgi:RNA polymerase sigma-70 factor (sigma-E family)